jgi:hypothetical protein
MAKSTRKEPVKRPLTPAVLRELGALGQCPKPDAAFKPEGPWTHRYRIWTCYGHTARGNGNVGALRIQHHGPRPGGLLDLTFERAILNVQGVVNRVTATVQCAADRLATPLSWTLRSEFTREGKPIAGLAAEEKVVVEGDRLKVQATGRTLERRSSSAATTADWCLFEAVQRLPFRAADPLEFDVLEGLSLLKRGQRLRYRGGEQAAWGSRTLRLHAFEQDGHGVLPYVYWLDESHRLLLVETGPRTYIFDDRADRALADAATLRARKGSRK